MPTIMRSGSREPGESAGLVLGLFWPRTSPWRLERSEVVIYPTGVRFCDWTGLDWIELNWLRRDGGGGMSECKDRNNYYREAVI